MGPLGNCIYIRFLILLLLLCSWLYRLASEKLLITVTGNFSHRNHLLMDDVAGNDLLVDILHANPWHHSLYSIYLGSCPVCPWQFFLRIYLTPVLSSEHQTINYYRCQLIGSRDNVKAISQSFHSLYLFAYLSINQQRLFLINLLPLIPTSFNWLSNCKHPYFETPAHSPSFSAHNC